MSKNPTSIENDIVIIDCGSTTTKALFFQKQKDGWQLSTDVNTPTTVEAPFNDVTVGVKKALEAINHQEAPLFATSSAGGGLQIVVLGLTQEISAAITTQVALNAGAIVSLTLSVDDARSFREKVTLLQSARPDLVILSGGFQGASPASLIELASVLKEAHLIPRFGTGYKVPVVYAGTGSFTDEIKTLLNETYEVSTVDCIVPSPGVSNGTPLIDKIQELFLTSVMQHAPGYHAFSSMVNADILPTPQAVTSIIEHYAMEDNASVIAVDIGGATTDIFTAHKTDNFSVQRSVSANIGMSYSAASVVKAAGGREQIARYCGDDIDPSVVETYIWNKTIRPTQTPQSVTEVRIEQALCRVALRIAFEAHKKLSGTDKQIRHYSRCIASGGVLSHAPDPKEVPWIIADGFNQAGFSEVFVDRIFMLPHLGILLKQDPSIAFELLRKECLIPLGILVGLTSKKKIAKGQKIASLLIDDVQELVIESGKRQIFSLKAKVGMKVTIKPFKRSIDCGQGKGTATTYLVSEAKNIELYIDGGRCSP